MSDPDMGTWYYGYDGAGNLKTQTDARGCVLSLSYDLLNRLRTKDSSGSCGTQVATTYSYDFGTNGKGKRTSMTDASGGASWMYDLRGRILSETKTIAGSAYTSQWSYNSADLPVTMTYPDNETVTTAYNALMQASTLNGTNAYVSGASYDPAGRLRGRTPGNGLTTTYSYRPWNAQGGRLASIVTGTVQNLAYTYDAAGNITQIVDANAGETHAYTYDSLDRLTGWTLNTILQETYTYNPTTGNLATKGGLALTYGDANHDHAVTGMGSNIYTYDANGNQITRTINGQSFTLGYDAENRMVSVSGPSLSASFVYDGDGRRVKSTINGVETVFVGNYYEVTSGVVTKYTFFGSARIAMRNNGTLYYPLTDHLGSTTLTTDSLGNAVSELRYAAFGSTRSGVGITLSKY